MIYVYTFLELPSEILLYKSQEALNEDYASHFKVFSNNLSCGDGELTASKLCDGANLARDPLTLVEIPPTELGHSGAVGSYDLSEMSDTELQRQLESVASEPGFQPGVSRIKRPA